MSSKICFDWQENTSESRKFWQKNSGKFYWRLLSDTSYKLIDLFVNISGMEISGKNISERFSIPERTIERNISFLKKTGILFSERHIYSINGMTRSAARYAIISTGLVSLSNHLQNLNIKKWRPTDDPFRSIMKKKSEIPANPHGSTSAPQLQNSNASVFYGKSDKISPQTRMGVRQRRSCKIEDKNLLSIKCNRGAHLKIRKLIYLEYIPSECNTPDVGPLPRSQSCEVVLKTPFGGNGGVIMKNTEYPAKETKVEHSRSHQHLNVNAKHNGNAQNTYQDASRGTKMKKTIRDMGFIKNELRIDSKQETLNVPNFEYEKFVDYWNDLADDGLRIPKCTKVKAGTPTKVFEKALHFFKEFQNGKLFANSRKFIFTNSYLNNLGVQNLGVPPFSDNYLFQIIKQVANLYHDNSYKFTSKFDSFLYSGFTAKAQAAHEYQSGFLELACMSFGKNLTLDSILDKLPNEERDILYQILIPMYQDLRKVNSDPTNDEMFQLLHGMKEMRHLWDSQYERQCTNSYQAKIGRIPATFYWFVDSYSDWVRDIKWSEIPLPMIFSQHRKYLSEYLNFLDEEL